MCYVIIMILVSNLNIILRTGHKHIEPIAPKLGIAPKEPRAVDIYSRLFKYRQNTL
jgi:hypothetical protein